MRVQSQRRYAGYFAVLLLATVNLSSDVVADDTLPLSSRLAGFEGYQHPLLSSVCGRTSCDGDSCDGISCEDPSQPCLFDKRRCSRFKLTEFNMYPTFSYLDDLGATYAEFEFASRTDFHFFEMENRTVLNVADLPSTIALGPTNPNGDPTSTNVRAQGFGDILSGFFFSPTGSHKQSTHLGLGPVFTFATATNEILGSDQYSAGPGAHFSTEKGRLTTGFFIWQSWGFGGSASDKRVNQLFGKPFVLYELNEKWNLVYIPLGMSHSWKAKKGDDWTIPLGGGLRRLFEIRGQKMGFQAQAFDYVARKPKDPEWELQFTIEFLYE